MYCFKARTSVHEICISLTTCSVFLQAAHCLWCVFAKQYLKGLILFDIVAFWQGDITLSNQFFVYKECTGLWSNLRGKLHKVWRHNMQCNSHHHPARNVTKPTTEPGQVLSLSWSINVTMQKVYVLVWVNLIYCSSLLMIFKAQACKNYFLIKEETVSLIFGKGFFLTVKLIEFLAAIYI